MAAAGAIGATILGGAYYLFGSLDQGAAFPTQITYYIDDGTPFTMSFAWSCGWDSGGGDEYPPPLT